MPSELTTLAVERTTLAIVASFTDDTGASVVPNAGSLTWTLTDTAGTVINSREDVAITSGASITIVLSGADLALTSASDFGRRVLTIEGTYDSDLGTGLPLKDQVSFRIINLVAVS